ncbi:MAG: TIGR04283 family arsenosugar biosynthesis glycosyltransferase [Alphaproteobacteria bacterium]
MISIIIPTLSEELTLPAVLDALRREPGEYEVIVVDGGSADRTIEIAQSYRVRVISAPPGRGSQLCAGVEAAHGEILWFLHADSIVPAGALAAIEKILAARPYAISGNFRLVFDGDTRFSRWLTGFYARIRWFGLYYGDSGIFVRRSAYDAVGGFRPIPLMEDLDFVRRLERFGRTCRVNEPPLITSSRRFEGRRTIAIVFGWIKLHLLFWLGISPERLGKIYQKHAPPVSRSDARHAGLKPKLRL